MDDLGTLLTRLVLTVALVVSNGFFVAAEFAMVKVRPTRIEQLMREGQRSARDVERVMGDIEAYLSVTQLGITLSSLALGWIGEQAISDGLLMLFRVTNLFGVVTVHVVAATLAFLIITFLQIVFGEMVPKTLAIRQAEATVLRTARLLVAFYRITYPVIWLLNRTAMGSYSLFGLSTPSEAEMAHTEEELRMLVTQSHESGVIDEAERTLFDNVFDFADRVAREVMVPRTDVKCLYVTDPFDESLQDATNGNHTRYPLCGDDKDQILGIIHVKDMYNAALSQGETKPSLADLARPVVSIPESMPINTVLKLLQQRRSEMAIVIDEYGGTAGILTTEDILEELVGEIQDEFDEERPVVERLANGGLSVDARLLLEEVGDYVELDLEAVEGVNTVGGWLYSKLGPRPVVGSRLHVGEHVFEVTEMRDLRILRLSILPAATRPPSPESR